jgi:hypothetical protein
VGKDEWRGTMAANKETPSAEYSYSFLLNHGIAALYVKSSTVYMYYDTIGHSDLYGSSRVCMNEL